eukprot:scaffold2667_cov218-Chaetoceros_neogracile.AAC.4
MKYKYLSGRLWEETFVRLLLLPFISLRLKQQTQHATRDNTTVVVVNIKYDNHTHATIFGIYRTIHSTDSTVDTHLPHRSFNPPHNGHIAMIKYLANTYENVILVIGMNPNKVYKVSPQTRADILHKMIAVRLGVRGMDKSRIRVKVVSGYIWRFCYSQNADIMIRGIRTWKKDGKEERALHILNTWGPIVFGPLKWPLKTVFMEGDTRYLDLSSTLIREACANQNARENGKRSDRSILEGMVPKQVEEEVIKAYS